LRNKPIDYSLPVSLAGKWKDAFNGSKANLDQVVKLEPYQYIVLQK